MRAGVWDGLKAVAWRLGWEGLLVTGIVVVAFGVRWYGVWWGFPDLLYGDEHDVAGQTLRMMLARSLAPDRFFKTATYSYILIPVFVPLAAWHFVGFILGFYDTPAFIELWRYYYAARTLSALFGAATVLLAYLVGKRMFNRNVGLTAALFFSFDLLHVETSHYAKAPVPSLLFVLLSFFFALRVYQDGKWRDYILAGLFAGLATAIQYNAIFLFLPLILAHILREQDGRVPLRCILISQRLYLGMFCVGIGFVIGNPYVLLNSGQFIGAMQVQFQKVFQVVQVDTLGSEVTRSSLFMSHRLSKYVGIMRGSMGLLGFGLAISGCVYSLIKRDRTSFLAVGFALPTFLLVSQYWLVSGQYVLPLIPFLYLWGAHLLVAGVDAATARCKPLARGYVNVALLVGVAVVVLWSPAHAVVRLDRKFAATDTRTLAREWITDKLSPGVVKIAREENVRPIPGYQSRKYWVLDMHDLDWYMRRGFTHLVTDSWHPARAEGFTAALARRTTLLAEITNGSTDGFGPTIRIYRIQPASTKIAPRVQTDIDFGGKLRLLGYEIDEARVRPGGLFNIALYWERLAPMKEDYEIVLTVGKDAQVLIRHRRPLLDGFLPTSRWQGGQVVVDDYDYAIPKTEWYTMTDADQQRYLNPDLARGFRLGLGRLGSLLLHREVKPPDGEVIRLTLERQVKGGQVVDERDPVHVLFSKISAEPGLYNLWLQVTDDTGRLLDVAGSSSRRIPVGNLEVIGSASGQ